MDVIKLEHVRDRPPRFVHLWKTADVGSVFHFSGALDGFGSLRLRRQPASSGDRRSGLVRRSAALPSPTAMFGRDRSQDRCLTGKMNFYLAALDDTERQPGDGPSIGLILCRERNRVVVEYALRNVSGPIGVAEYRVLVADVLPAALAEALPTVAEIETGIGPPQDD
jgi:hypothetical protein